MSVTFILIWARSIFLYCCVWLLWLCVFLCCDLNSCLIWLDPPSPFLFFFRRAPDLTLSRTIELFWNKTIRISIPILHVCAILFCCCLLVRNCAIEFTMQYKDFTSISSCLLFLEHFDSVFFSAENFCFTLAVCSHWLRHSWQQVSISLPFRFSFYSNLNFNWLKFGDWRNSKLPPKQTNTFFVFF